MQWTILLFWERQISKNDNFCHKKWEDRRKEGLYNRLINKRFLNN